MASRPRNMQWHVPPGAWFQGGPGTAGSGIANVGEDIILDLVSTEGLVAGGSAIPDSQGGRIWIERVVGQYNFSGGEVVAVPHFVHHRVYEADSDGASVGLRNLTTQDDAETSFMWHQVDPFPVGYNNLPLGGWGGQTNLASIATVPFASGRLGHVDIRVGRMLEPGRSLVWHTQISPVPVGAGYGLRAWIRVLLAIL